MKFFIDSLALQRLGDPDVEIRQKSLNELTGILKNNILFEAESHLANEELEVVNLDELTRQLIRWFQYKPITNGDEVLDLLILIISRRDFLKHITQTISVSRLKKELLKIAKLLLPEYTSIKLQVLNQLLNDFESDLLMTSNEAPSFETIESTTAKRKYNNDANLIERMQRINLNSPHVFYSRRTSIDSNANEEEIFNNISWIQLTGSDLEIFTAIDEKLLMYKEDNKLKEALDFLKISITDFLPEYFLQQPSILETLMDIIWKVSKVDAVEIIRLIRFILNGLKARWKESESINATYISVKKYINKILQIFTDFFEHFHDNFNSNTLHQELLNETYSLLIDIANFIKETQEVCEIYLNELLNMIGKLTRCFRHVQSDENFYNCRLNYIVCIYLLNIFIDSFNMENIFRFSDNNVWEYELDLSLLDCALKEVQDKIYKMTTNNRINTIREDQDLNFLLDISSLWRPLVQIFQNHESMTHEEIILKGLESLEVIRIHKNPEFVDVIFNAIEKSALNFHKNQKLKEAAEKIFLRLISIDVPEIKKRIYLLAHLKLKTKLTEDSNDPNLKDVDVCAIIGIPFTTEIFAEMLCFGFNNDLEEEENQKNVRLILFAILRGKMIFANHWHVILEAMKPVLAMLPSLFSKDPKLGFLSFDIFNENSGLTKIELIQAYARYLFCSHQNAREMAKRKLLEDLEETEFIDILPDNFCILPNNQISDLQLPDYQIGYDHEAYLTTTKLLKATSSHNDPDLLQSILLQLSVLMNSRKCCIQSHDDNLWVYFMSSLDMNFPNHAIIRKLTINILHKWAICISTFRIYLAVEPKVLKFLINTLIYYQDDVQIKKQTSSLLFILLFSDFIVANDKATSLPSIVKSLECPFKFTEHWKVSPFNKISKLEYMCKAMDEEDDENRDIKLITEKYIRCTFARCWFKQPIEKLNGASYYTGLGDKVLKIPEKLMLNLRDYKYYKLTSSEYFIQYSCCHMENVTSLDQFNELIQKVLCILILPDVNVEPLAKLLNEKLRKCKSVNSKYVKFLELFQNIVPFVNENAIIELIKGDSVLYGLTKTENHTNNEIYTQMLRAMNNIVKMCKPRNHLANRIIKAFNDEYKINFPSRVFEKLIENMQENYNKAFNDITKLPLLKLILTCCLNMLNNFPMTLDEPFLNNTFNFLLNTSKCFIKSPYNASGSLRMKNSHAVEQVFGIIERLCSLSLKINLKPEDYNILFLWLSDDSKMNKAMLWKIIAQLTKRGNHFIEFSKGFDSVINIPFYEIFLKCICKSDQSLADRNGQALIIGNMLDYISNETRMCMDNRSSEQIKSDLVKIFINQKQNSIEGVSFIIKKMIHNNIPEVEDIIKDKRIIECVVLCGVEYLDIVAVCYKFKPLEKHVLDIVEGISDDIFAYLFSQFENPLENDEKSLDSHQKKINRNILEIILISLQSSKGFDKIHKNLMRDVELLNDFVIVLTHGLKDHFQPGEVLFHLEILLAFLNSSNTNANQPFNNLEFTVLKSEYLLKLSTEKVTNVSSNVKYKTKNVAKQVHYAVDLILLSVVSLFNDIDATKMNADHKYDIKAIAFLVIKKLLACSEQARNFAVELDLLEILFNKILLSIISMGDKLLSVATKKEGVHKCQVKIKEMCLYLRAIVEWSSPLNGKMLHDIFQSLMKMFNWIDSDTIFMNSFVNFLRELCYCEPVAKACVTQEYNGMPLMKIILKKAQSITSKPPHTETNIALLKNLLNLIIAYSHMVEIRLMLKNAKIFQMMDILCPQLQKNRKNSWNDVTLIWIKFFEKLSQFEDAECNAGHISLLCRLIRIEDEKIGKTSLGIIRNFAMKSSVGFVVLHSNDFMETVDIVLNGKNSFEKQLILQTLLSIATMSEQMRSKLKNSALNRKLKDQLTKLKLTDGQHSQIYSLTSILSNILYK